jgi:hypothetical protein
MATSERGSSLDQFVDFTLATRQAPLTDPDSLVSQASRYRTHLFPLMLKGLTKKEYVQSGNELIDVIQLNYTNRRVARNFTDTYTFTGSDSLTKQTMPWRKYTVDAVVHEAEIDLQSGDTRTVFKKVKNAKMSELELSFWEGNEEDLWADPNFETMEAATLVGTGAQMSLRAILTDDGGAPTSSNGGVATGSTTPWTSIYGIDPAVKTNFKNQYSTYDNTNSTTREAAYILAMDEMFVKLQWVSPSDRESYVKSTMMQKLRIINNLSTHLLLIKLAVARNNILTPRNDIGYQAGEGAYANVTYHGIPMLYIHRLDSVDTGSDTGTTNKYRSRYYNFNHIKPVFHNKHFRRMRVLDGGTTNPDAKVFLEDTWQNIWTSNRREQGIVRAA